VTCRDAIAILADYLEMALARETLEALEQHLQDCAPCVAYLNTYRRTRDLTAEAQRVAMPLEMKERLRRFLLARLQDAT
jgi:predicted anti-sigma-YlaC factor YlaD